MHGVRMHGVQQEAGRRGAVICNGLSDRREPNDPGELVVVDPDHRDVAAWNEATVGELNNGAKSDLVGHRKDCAGRIRMIE